MKMTTEGAPLTWRQSMLGILNRICGNKLSKRQWFRRWVGGAWVRVEEQAWIDGMIPVVMTTWVFLPPGTEIAPGLRIAERETWEDETESLPPAPLPKAQTRKKED